MYRWHVLDPIRFADDLRVDIQALGWRRGRRYLPLQDDIASTAFFYLDRPVRTASGAADGRRDGDPVATPDRQVEAPDRQVLFQKADRRVRFLTGKPFRAARAARSKRINSWPATPQAPSEELASTVAVGPARRVVDGAHGDAGVVALDQDRRAARVQTTAQAVAQPFLGDIGAGPGHGLDQLGSDNLPSHERPPEPVQVIDS